MTEAASPAAEEDGKEAGDDDAEASGGEAEGGATICSLDVTSSEGGGEEANIVGRAILVRLTGHN